MLSMARKEADLGSYINPVVMLLLIFYIDCIFHTVPARCAVFLL